MTENERLTHKRMNGIKEGYWSPRKKEEPLQRLGKYEDTGMGPEEISAAIGKKLDTDMLQRMNTQIHLLKELRKARKWIPVEERLPEDEQELVLVCMKDDSIDTAKYSPYSKRWYIGSMCSVSDLDELNVIAWMPLPKPYKSN